MGFSLNTKVNRFLSQKQYQYSLIKDFKKDLINKTKKKRVQNKTIKTNLK